MIEKTLEELDTIMNERRADCLRLAENKDKQQPDSGSYDYYHMREQVRCSRQKIHILVLKKQKVITSQIKHLILKLIGQNITELDAQLAIVFEPESDYSKLTISAILQLVNLFCSKAKIPQERSSAMMRPNNVEYLLMQHLLLQDFLMLTIDHYRNHLKELLFSVYQKRKYTLRLPTQEAVDLSTHRSSLKNKICRSKTQVAETSFPMPKDTRRSKKLSVQKFEEEHGEYLAQSRKQFLQKFDEEQYQQKANMLYIQLLNQNTKNKQAIKNYLQKSLGMESCTFKLQKQENSLYTKQEQAQMVKRLQQKLRSQSIKTQQPPQRQAEERELKAFRKQLIESNLRQIKIQQKIYSFVGRPPEFINEWLPLYCLLTGRLEEPLQIKAKVVVQEAEGQTLKQKLMTHFSVSSDHRPSTDFKIPKSYRYRNEIVGCFSRRKVKEFIEGSVAIQNKVKVHSNTTVILPSISQKRIKAQGGREPTLLRQNSAKEKGVINSLSSQIKKLVQSQQNTQISNKKLRNLKQTLSLKVPVFL